MLSDTAVVPEILELELEDTLVLCDTSVDAERLELDEAVAD